jgi:hypothetical protein
MSFWLCSLLDLAHQIDLLQKPEHKAYAPLAQVLLGIERRRIGLLGIEEENME